MGNSNQNPHKIVSIRLRQAQSHHQAGRLREAEALFSQTLKEFGHIPDAVLALAEAAAGMGEVDATVSLFERANRLAPNQARILGPFGTFMGRIGRSAQAAALLRQAVDLSPGEPKLHYNLAKALIDEGAISQAVEAYRQACRLDPKFTKSFVNLGNALSDLGLHDDAASAYRSALKLEPESASFWSNFLLSSQYAEGVSAASLFELSKGFEENVGRRLARHAKPFANDPIPDRRLRIGYVSGDLKRHPVGYFMSGVFSNHDKAAFELFAYSCNLKEDDLTATLKKHVDHWVPASQMSDKELAKRIRDDGIDILVDLAGHTGKNRLEVFAMKPAPLQVAWCGYVGTTGLRAMDAIIADRHHILTEEEPYYVEKVCRLPHSWLCCPQIDEAPEVSPPPSLAKGFVTFGCFNNPAKISLGAMRLWQSILETVPGSRLALRAAFFTSAARIGAYRRRFQEAGVDTKRVDFLPALPHAELLAAYGDIDIALDPSPYSGGITTLEALWMGVPVVTKPGASFPGRHTTSFLQTIGLDEMVAKDETDYIERAVGLAGSPSRLQALRSSLRDKMAASPLTAHARFTGDVESLLRGLWREWCANSLRPAS